jgi:hypothetical protein
MGERVIELMIDIASDQFLPRLERSLCGRCDLRVICDRLETGCPPLAILEDLFLLGRISYREATRCPELPDSGAMTRVKVPKKWVKLPGMEKPNASKQR